MNLIETLNKYGHLSPDEIVKQLDDPLSRFVCIKDVTPEVWDEWKKRDICFYNALLGQWDGTADAEHVYRCQLTGVMGGPTDVWLDAYWFFIGYEHRLNPDLEFPTA